MKLYQNHQSKTKIKFFFAILLFLFNIPICIIAQNYKISGQVTDTSGNVLVNTTVSLLSPMDSTLAYYSISDRNGFFEIKNIARGMYMLQLGYVGYEPQFYGVELPRKGNDFLGVFVMKPASLVLDEVVIKSEKIPFLIKGDTVEYNSGAYRLNVNDAAENLLKKLPGIEVDQQGNVKAQGENVAKILVDGKEFFGGDSKNITKNLPADAVEKVQVYDDKSEQSNFSGIDDGSSFKTINFVLKEGKKNGYFGDMETGVGDNERYAAQLKLFRFTKNTQIAGIGMMNNINKFGFSVQDFIAFNGGLQSLMQGGRLTIDASEDMPFDFGQEVYGKFNTQSGGVNFSADVNEKNSFNISYIANAGQKSLIQDVYTKYYLEVSDFEKVEDAQTDSKNIYHRISGKYRFKPNSKNLLVARANLFLSDLNRDSYQYADLKNDSDVISQYSNTTFQQRYKMTGNTNISYVKKMYGIFSLLKMNVEGSISEIADSRNWNNNSRFLPLSEWINNITYNNQDNYNFGLVAKPSLTSKLYKNIFLEYGVDISLSYQEMHQKARFGMMDSAIRVSNLKTRWGQSGPYMKLFSNKKKNKFNIGGTLAQLHSHNYLDNFQQNNWKEWYLMGTAGFEKEFKSGTEINVLLNNDVSMPDITQLSTVLYNPDPTFQVAGNPLLKPEKNYNAALQWMYFDQFSMFSSFIFSNFTYTTNKIGWDKQIGANFVQHLRYINTPYEYRLNSSASVSSPIRLIKTNITVDYRHRFSKGITVINQIENITMTNNHDIAMRFSNRNKNKIDASIGGGYNHTNVQYLKNSRFNSQYYYYSILSSVNYYPKDIWNILLEADLRNYNAAGFNNEVFIPLVNAEVSCHIVKNRWIAFVRGYDLLDKSNGIQRISKENYLQEIRSNIVGRYVMAGIRFKFNRNGAKM